MRHDVSEDDKERSHPSVDDWANRGCRFVGRNDMSWALIGIVVSIASLPMGLVVLYLQSIRQGQADLGDCVRRIERQYTTKREWERELSRMRSQIDRLTALVTELATRMRTDQGLLAQLERDRRRMLVMNERLGDLARKAVAS